MCLERTGVYYIGRNTTYVDKFPGRELDGTGRVVSSPACPAPPCPGKPASSPCLSCCLGHCLCRKSLTPQSPSCPLLLWPLLHTAPEVPTLRGQSCQPRPRSRALMPPIVGQLCCSRWSIQPAEHWAPPGPSSRPIGSFPGLVPACKTWWHVYGHTAISHLQGQLLQP